MSEPILSVHGLAVSYRNGEIPAVKNVSFDLLPGQVLALVGESGSGKSTTALAILGLLPSGSRIEAGEIRLNGRRVDGLTDREMRAIRGRAIGFVPQDPTVSLDPTQRIGHQIAEALTIHAGYTRRSVGPRVIQILRDVGLDEPERRARQYPHEFSGGMRQRVLIGMAWACTPPVVVADEPTSNLDVTVQKQVLDRMDDFRRESGTACVMVTHDLNVAAERAHQIVVMRDGRIVESGLTAQILADPGDPYTRQLLNARPARIAGVPEGRRPDGAQPLVRAVGLVKDFQTRDTRGRRQRFRAVGGIDIEIAHNETLGVVGESGSGKSTLGRMIMCLERPTAGRIDFDGVDVSALPREELRRMRRRFQIIHQNPYSSLSPLMSIADIVAEPLRAFGEGTRSWRVARVAELLDQVGLSRTYLDRTPSELSGGQRQRVAIARALALRPELVVCDEPVSALDVTVQAKVLDLLSELQRELGLSYLFISHDLSVVRAVSHRIAVMRNGEIVETGDAEAVFGNPQHEYTRSLLEAVPGLSWLS